MPTLTSLTLCLAGVSAVQALEIDGVQNAALDQPQINAAIRLPGTTQPVTGLAEDLFGNIVETFNIQAFYDTGASGVLMSTQTADALGLTRARFEGQDVIFEDVGVGGADAFNVSEPLMIDLAPFPSVAIDDPATYDTVYTQRFGPVRMQVGPLGGISNPLLQGLDVFGMPLFVDKSVHMDVSPTHDLSGNINTRVYNYGSREAAAIRTQRTVQMSYGDFARFTRVLPDGAQAPTLQGNPFIGPDPVAVLNGDAETTQDVPGITVRHNGLSQTGSWLFDTGAAASIFSEARAAELGITYDPDSEAPVLLVDGVEAPNQFQLSIGGIGGTTQLAGLYLDELIVPTIEGDGANPDDPKHLKFLNAPVLVGDITVLDPVTQESLTLDGVFGMNFLAASIFITEPFGIGDLRAGAFNDLVFDHPTGQLRMRFNPDVATFGDVNVDGLIDAEDIDLLFELEGNTDYLDFADLNNSGAVDNADVTLLVTDVLNTTAGDANLDGQVDLLDLSSLAASFDGIGGWSDGDFNGDQWVNLLDLSLLATHFETSSIPEPASLFMVMAGLLRSCRR
ncbi:aspartyl protease family protein [Mucisphaera calidilacus]|uniref:aspartyl protease family protein n=1 Tax=Mucisphaera calidilacus TaxID=2527982 RepID=UPI0011A3E06A|nr:aspartyl protease family protein [Mucisphaera calidilacus]